MLGMTGNQTAVVIILVALMLSVAMVNVVEHIASVRKARWEAFATNVKNGATPHDEEALTSDALPSVGIEPIRDVPTAAWGSAPGRRPIRDNPQA